MLLSLLIHIALHIPAIAERQKQQQKGIRFESKKLNFVCRHDRVKRKLSIQCYRITALGVDTGDYRAAPSAAVGRTRRALVCVLGGRHRGWGGATGAPRVSRLRAGKMAGGSWRGVLAGDAGRLKKQEGGGGQCLGRGRQFTDHRCGGQDTGRHAVTPLQDGPVERPRVRRDVTMIFTNHPFI